MDQATPQPDFYTRLLGIAPGKRPPNYYELLGLALFTSNFRWIESAVHRRMEELDPFALHPDAAVRRGMQELVTEVAQARVCLVDPETKRKYDRELAASLGLNTETVDLPAPASRRKIAIATALAACAVMVIAVTVAAVLVLHRRSAPMAQANGAANAPCAVAVANQPANAATPPANTASHPAEAADARQEQLDALVTQARGLCDAGNFEPALNLLTQAQAIRPSPQLAAEIKKVHDAKLQHDQAAQALAKLLVQAEATLQAMPPSKAALSPAQKDQLKQLRQSLEAPAATSAQAKALSDRIDALLAPDPQVTLDLGQGVSMKFRLIPKGQFLLGSPPTEPGRGFPEGPQHQVTISKPFYMGIYSVTQAQWQAVMGTEPWEDRAHVMASPAPTFPATYVDWDDAVAFCLKLSAKSGRTVRLPMEAQREYACRAGTTTRFWHGDDLNGSSISEYAWYGRDFADDMPRIAGQLKPNAWGLYDMTGNLLEWCYDWVEDNYIHFPANIDPSGLDLGDQGAFRAVRGSSCGDTLNDCRCARRTKKAPGTRSYTLGFRVVLDIDQPDPAWDKFAKERILDIAVAELVDPGLAMVKAMGPGGPDVTAQQRTKLAEAMKLAQRALAIKANAPKALALKGNIESFPFSRTLKLDLGQDVCLDTALVPAGEFLMGTPELTAPNVHQAGNQHKEVIANPFYAGIYPVTRPQWKAVMGTTPWETAYPGCPNVQRPGNNYPALHVSWDDVTEFCRRASAKTGRAVRLPTEAQRECACRAGSNTQFCYGDDPKFEKLGEYAWFAGNGQDRVFAHFVGLKKPNAFGLYDMHGNVQECCRDPKVPIAPAAFGKWHVMRGACWFDQGSRCQSDQRVENNATGGEWFGFRVIVEFDPAIPIEGKAAAKPDKLGADKEWPANLPEPATWKIVNSRQPGAVCYCEIRDDGVVKITTFTPQSGQEKKPKPKWEMIGWQSCQWIVRNGKLCLMQRETEVQLWGAAGLSTLPLRLRSGQRIHVNGVDLTFTKVADDVPEKESKAASNSRMSN